MILIRIIKEMFRNQKGGDRIIFTCVVGLALFGIIMIGSVCSGRAAVYGASFAMTNMAKQAAFVGAGLACMMLFSRLFDTKYITYQSTKVLFFVSVLSLLACLFWEVNNNHNWIFITKSITIQPSEFVKIVMIVILSFYFTRMFDSFRIPTKFKSLNDKNEFYKQRFCKSVLYPIMACVVILLIMLVVQGDLGSTLILCVICATIFFMAPSKFYRKFKALALACGAIAIVPLGFFLQGYQADRITSWLEPLSDPSGKTLQLVNGLIAITRGELKGVGFGNSTQKFGYIPNGQNDFIAPIISEELGAIGLTIVIIATALIIYILLDYSKQVKDPMSKIILVGIASYFFIHLFVNIGGVSGLIPMTGVPLLLVSAGGSSTLAAFIAIGIAQAIIRKHHRSIKDTK